MSGVVQKHSAITLLTEARVSSPVIVLSRADVRRRSQAMLSSASQKTEDRMHELRSEIIGDRRVRLVAQSGDYHAVIIEVRGPRGWEDISLRADHYLAFDVASRRYRQRVAEQEARAIEWAKVERPQPRPGAV
jgi:hypothetical protein